MKNKVLCLLIYISLIFTGCGKCGKDVYLGEFKLMPKSIEDWFPYNEIDKLTYKNVEGDIMVLNIVVRKEEMIREVYRYICYENYADEASEMIDAESIAS